MGRLLTRAIVALATPAVALAVLPGSPGGASPGATPDRIVVERFATTSVGRALGETGVSTLAPIVTEIQKPKRLGRSPLRGAPASGDTVDLAPGTGTPTASAPRTKSNPRQRLSFEAVNHRDSRLADGGNQFSGEPADLGVCAGNGYVLETVNSALRVYDAATGTPVSPVRSLNELYGFPPAINRTTGAFGPFTFDISCHYDPATRRWFHLAVDLDQDPTTGAFNGRNYLDLAVSTSADPTGTWNVYRIPGMNDGTEGTPDHQCAGGPCFADFPHIGVDAHGVYISTNEFPLFADGFTGAQVYAISKASLVAGAGSIETFLFDTSQDPWSVRPGEPGFTVWPALPADRQFNTSAGGTQLFVSSNAVFDDVAGDSSEVVVWALTNTSSLTSANPAPQLSRTIVPSLRYAVPPPAVQKDGDIPLADCLNDTSGFFDGTNCGAALFGLPPQNVPLGVLDTSDSRVLDVRWANGKLWAVLGTAAEVQGQQQAGVAWFVLSPAVSSSGVSATMRRQGILAAADESLAYPTIGVTASGRGAIGFTRVGPSLYPSAGYASIDDVTGTGPIHLAAAGNAPSDGFTLYPPIGGNRPRWGDYGAAAVEGSTIYLAAQYVEQGPCDLSSFIGTGCGGTRTTLANWSTRVTKLST